ncbi:MAG: M24 family metallopeptidase [Vicinamibacterales bacterium]
MRDGDWSSSTSAANWTATSATPAGPSGLRSLHRRAAGGADDGGGGSDRIIAAMRPGVTLADVQRAAAIPAAARPYMQTGTFFGHHLGLSSGDPFVDDVALAPGMVITVEPWYYNHDRGLSVFTEDVILITADGRENLTGHVARTPDGLEALMRAGRP